MVIKAVPRTFAATDAVRLSKTSVPVSARYCAASKKDSLFNCAAVGVLNVASLTLLAAFSLSHAVVIFYMT
jgi:hypothetical protein